MSTMLKFDKFAIEQENPMFQAMVFPPYPYVHFTSTSSFIENISNHA